MPRQLVGNILSAFYPFRALTFIKSIFCFQSRFGLCELRMEMSVNIKCMQIEWNPIKATEHRTRDSLHTIAISNVAFYYGRIVSR